MTNFPDRDVDRPSYPRAPSRPFGGNAQAWVIAVVAVIVILGLVLYSGGMTGNGSHMQPGAAQQTSQPAEPAKPAAPPAPTAPKP